MALEHRHRRDGLRQALLGDAIEVVQRHRVGSPPGRAEYPVELGIAKAPGVLADQLGGADCLAVIEDVQAIGGVGVPVAAADQLKITGVTALGDLGQGQQVDVDLEADLLQVGLDGHGDAARVGRGFRRSAGARPGAGRS